MAQKNYLALVNVVLVLCALTVFGCGPKRPETASVSGRVTYQGKPVAEGRIVFHPEDGRRPAMAAINSDGSYRLTTFESEDGALPGKHRVTIKAVRVVGGAPVDELSKQSGEYVPNNAPLPTLEWLVPEKYSNLNTTTLTAEVKSGGNVINFDLP